MDDDIFFESVKMTIPSENLPKKLVSYGFLVKVQNTLNLHYVGLQKHKKSGHIPL